MFCSKCGNELVEGSAFCSRCGNPVNPQYTGSTPLIQEDQVSDDDTTENLSKETAPAKKKKRKVIIPIVIMLLVAAIGVVAAAFVTDGFGLLGNSETESSDDIEVSYEVEESDTSSEVDNSEESVDSSEEIEAEEITYSLDEIPDLMNGTYIEQSGVCTEIVEYCSTFILPCFESKGGSKSFSDDYDALSLPKDVDDSYHVWMLNNDETGDTYEFKQIPADARIVTTINCEEAYACQVLAEDLWCAPSGTSLIGYDEVNGVDINGVTTLQNALNGTGIEMMVDKDWGRIAYVSYYPTSVICGYYTDIGTDFIEEEVVFNIPCFITLSGYIGYGNALPVEKTKDGYFIIDTSLLDSGKYILNVGNVNYLIEK